MLSGALDRPDYDHTTGAYLDGLQEPDLRVYDDSCAIAHKMEETQRVLQALGAGPALPDRFNPLERLLETAVKSVRLKSTPEVQMSGILALCEEMQRILKIAFMGTLGGRNAAIYL